MTYILKKLFEKVNFRVYFEKLVP